MTPKWLVLPACVAIAACGGADDSTTVGGVTPSEAKALNDAAEMLDESAANSAGAPPFAETPAPAS